MVNSMGFTRSKEKSRLKTVDEVFLFILVPNMLHFRLYRLVTRQSHLYCTIPNLSVSVELNNGSRVYVKILAWGMKYLVSTK